MSEKLSTQPYKGTRDFYPQEMRLRNRFFGVVRRVLETAAFEEYNGPMLESLDLYAAKSGEEIATKQTYNFVDRGDRRLALRPEMTPTVARMVAAKMNELVFPLKWFSIPAHCFFVTKQTGFERHISHSGKPTRRLPTSRKSLKGWGARGEGKLSPEGFPSPRTLTLPICYARKCRQQERRGRRR